MSVRSARPSWPERASLVRAQHRPLQKALELSAFLANLEVSRRPQPISKPTAFAAALTHASSSSAVPPLAPTAPTSRPSSKSGTPPA